MNKIVLWVIRIAGGIVAIIVVLMAVAAFIFSRPSYQQKIVTQATDMLSEKLQTRVSIDSVDISVVKGAVSLFGVEIDDQQQRKMLRIGELKVRLKPLALIHREIIISEAGITGLDALLLKPSKEEPANFQFVIDAFKKDAKKKPKDKDEDTQKAKKTPFKVDVDNVKLEDIHVKYNDMAFNLRNAHYDKGWLGKQKMVINDVDATWTSHSKKDSLVSNFVSLQQLTASSETKKRIEDGGRLLVEIAKLRYKNDNHKPRKNVGKPKRGFFDAKHLDITADLKLTIDSIAKGTVVGELTQMTATDTITGIDIRDLKARIRGNKERINLTDITIQQKNTVLNIDKGEMTLPNKKEGRHLSYTTGTIKGKVLLKDISRAFAPVLNKFSLPLNLSATMSGTDSTIAFRDILVTTDDKKISIKAIGDIKNLRDKEKLNIRFDVSNMTAKGDIKEKVINQFTVKKLMMKQLHNLGDITYKGQFFVVYKRVMFQGRLGTAAGPLDFTFAIDGLNKYLTGHASTKNFHLAKVMEMESLGTVEASADFKIDISKPRTAIMRREKGGKLPIGSVNALVDDCSYKGIHVRHLKANIKSDGAVANGELFQHGNYRDLSCNFTFTNTDEMHKIKITNPGIKFHKISEEDKQAKKERNEKKKIEKQKAKEAKKAQKAKDEKEGKKKKKFLGIF